MKKSLKKRIPNGSQDRAKVIRRDRKNEQGEYAKNAGGYYKNQGLGRCQAGHSEAKCPKNRIRIEVKIKMDFKHDLSPKMEPKSSPKGAKMEPKSTPNPLKIKVKFQVDFGGLQRARHPHAGGF